MIAVRLALAALTLFAISHESLAQETGQEVRGKTLVDHDYAFRIEAPDDTWQVFLEAEAQRLAGYKYAVAGMKSGAIRGVVVAERVPGTMAAAFAEALIEHKPVTDKVVLEKKATDVFGHDAVTYSMTGKVDGRAIQYRNAVIVRGDWVFQVGAWAPVSQAEGGQALLVVENAFSFTDGAVTGRSIRQPVADTHGVGWRVRDGVFESAPYRLMVNPKDGWDLMIGDELTEFNRKAEIGLRHDTTETHITDIPVAATVADPERFLDGIRTLFRERFGEPVETLELLVGGQPRLFDVHEANFGSSFEVLQAVWIDDGICHQIQAIYAAGVREDARQALVSGLASLEFLSSTEGITLREEIAKLGDVTNSVGPDYSVRGGVFRDFTNGVIWHRPTGGIWRLITRDSAPSEVGSASTLLQEKTMGLGGHLLIESVPDVDGRKFHESIVSGMCDSIGVEEVPEVTQIELENVEGLSSRIEGHYLGSPTTWIVTTFTNRDTAAQLVLWGLSGNAATAEQHLDEAIKGFGILPDDLHMMSLNDDRYEDQRLGYGFEMRAGLETVQDQTPTGLQPAGSIMLIMGEQDEGLLTFAFHDAGEGRDEAYAFDMMVPLAKQMIGEASAESGTLVEETFRGNLGDRPAAGRRISDGETTIEVLVLRRDRTVYGVLIEAAREEVAQVRRESFYLLP